MASIFKSQNSDLVLDAVGTTSEIAFHTNGVEIARIRKNGSMKVADATLADEALSKGQLLAEIKAVDGVGSGLDADLVQGVDIVATKLDSVSYTANDVLTKIKTVDGAGSGLDADLLDGKHTDVTAVPDTIPIRGVDTAIAGKNQCTAWVNFDGTGVTIRDSYNVSSVVNNGDNTFRVYFQTPMNTLGYIVNVHAPSYNSTGVVQAGYNNFSSALQLGYVDIAIRQGAALQVLTQMGVLIFGGK